MDISERISCNLTCKIKELRPEKNDIELEQIKYGIHIFLNNVIKLPIVFIIAYFLGIFMYTLVAFISFSFVRNFASGIHARKSITCFISTTLIFLGTAYLGYYIKLNLLDISISFLACIILAYFYAPADTEEKPFVSKKLRKRLKFLSLISILIMYIACLVFISTKYPSVITFAVLAECISISPVTYTIFKRRYNNHDTF